MRLEVVRFETPEVFKTSGVFSDLNTDGIQYNYLNLPYTITVKNASGEKGTLTYIYDAAGNKLEKRVHENADASNNNQPKDSKTTYTGPFVYENDQLQFITHEEGRFRYVKTPTLETVNTDYFIKDYLGNVRMVLTDELRQDKYPVATLEDKKLQIEKAYYYIDEAQIVAGGSVTGLPAYTNDNGFGNNPSDPSFESTNSTKLYKLNSNTAKTGLGVTLEVMAGDRISFWGKSFYNQANSGGSAANSNLVAADIINGLFAAAGGTITTAHEIVTADQLLQIPSITSLVSLPFVSTSNTDPTAPKAYMNYIFFDENFKCYAAGTLNPAGGAGDIKTYSILNIPANKNGYVYIYCSNESPVNVFFDNVQVVHTRGPMLEETHYYPFGLTMSGISSRASGDVVNKYQFNGNELQNKEFGDGGGLEMYDFNSRFYDHQIGRFRQIDPLSNQGGQENWTPYHFGFNNPILRNDPTGMFAPIYDTEGNLLGTDDQGLQGKAIVMDKENFQQGMKHDDAMQNSLGVQGLEDDAAGKKLLDSYNGLKDRPDYDGFVTRREGIDWAKSHPGALQNPTPENMLYIDASKLDFGNITTHDFKNGLNKPTPIQLNSADNFIDGYLFGGKLEGTVYALGRVNMILLDNSGSVKIVNDEATDYDWNRGGGWPRSYLIDRERKNEGLNDTHGFKTFYYGTGHLRPAVKLPEPGTLEFEMVR